MPSIVSARGAVPLAATPFAADELTLLRRSADALTTVAGSLRG